MIAFHRQTARARAPRLHRLTTHRTARRSSGVRWFARRRSKQEAEHRGTHLPYTLLDGCFECGEGRLRMGDAPCGDATPQNAVGHPA